MTQPDSVLEFWFGKDPQNPMAHSKKWWMKDPDFDREIEAKFGEDIKKARSEGHEDWKKTAEGCLALIILLDQFSRNVFRDTPQAFAQDELALQACLEGMEAGLDRRLPPIQRVFFYMPLMHSEDPAIHQRSVEIFKNLAEEGPDEFKKTLKANYDYAIRHAKIIERFNRYPHRNKILGRDSTPEEIEFLKEPGSSF